MTVTDIERVWAEPEHGGPETASLTFSGSHWTFMGCNGDGGRWLVLSDGRLMRLNYSGAHGIVPNHERVRWHFRGCRVHRDGR